METGAFIIARWVLTFGVVLAWMVYELRKVNRLQQERDEQRA